MSDDLVLQVKSLSKTYRQGATDIDVLMDFNFQVTQGECVAVMGASGSGKTTLLNLCGGLDDPTKGMVFINGISWSELAPRGRALSRNRHVGFVYQFHHLLAEFSAVENVALPAMIGQFSHSEAKSCAERILKKVGLEHRLDHRPNALSGGERQRVAIARSLVMQPSVVLMDEPTGNLDGETGLSIIELLLDLNRSSDIAFVIVTHDMAVASKMDRIVSLDQYRQ